jgi:hypothetical protein
MQKGENIISIALAAAVLLAILAIQRRWNPASLKEVATSAEDFLLTTTGMRGEVPNIPGYERLKTYRLDRYRAALYRSSPAPLVFAPGRFVIYNRNSQPVFKLETLEGSKDSWTALYDFAGRRGLAAPGSRARPEYTRNLTGNRAPDVVVGQYSGGDHCCTLATVLELSPEAVTVLGRIDGLDGLPFEGLEVRKLDKDPAYQFIAHRPYMTGCGPHTDAADILAVFAYAKGRYTDQTARFADYLESALRQNLSKWKQEKARTLVLLQTIAANFAELGEKDQGKRFFAMNLNSFLPNLKQRGVDPNLCIEDLENLVDRLPSVSQLSSTTTTPR